MIKLTASTHAKIKIKERMGIEGKREIKQLIKDSYHKGASIYKHWIPRDTLRWVKKKLSKNYFNRCKNHWRIYKGHLFLFSNNLTLITVIPVPKHLIPPKKNVDKDIQIVL